MLTNTTSKDGLLRSSAADTGRCCTRSRCGPAIRTELAAPSPSPSGTAASYGGAVVGQGPGGHLRSAVREGDRPQGHPPTPPPPPTTSPAWGATLRTRIGGIGPVPGRCLRSASLWSWRCAAAGATIFAASDTVLAINRFAGAVPYAKLVIMATYYLAQYSIALSARGSQPRPITKAQRS